MSSLLIVNIASDAAALITGNVITLR